MSKLSAGCVDEAERGSRDTVVKDAEEEDVGLLSGASAGMIRTYLAWDFGLSDSENVHNSGQAKENSGRSLTSTVSEVAQGSSNKHMHPIRAMLKYLEDPMYKTLSLEDDLKDWEVLVPEEVIRRAENLHGENGELGHRSNISALVAFFFEAVPGINAP